MPPDPTNPTSPPGDLPAATAAAAPAAPAAEPAPGRKRWRLSPVCLMLAVLVAFISVATGFRQLGAHSTAFNGGYLVGRAVGAILFPLFFGGIGYFVGRRSSRAGNTIFAVVALLSLASMAGNEVMSRQRAALEDLKERTGQRATQMKRDYDRNGYIKDFDRRVSDTVNDLDRTAQATSGIDSAVMTAEAAIVRRMGALMTPLNAALQKFIEAGGVDAATLPTKEAIAKRRAMADKIAKTNTAALAYLQRMEGDFLIEVRAAGAPDSSLLRLARTFSENCRRSTLIAIRQDDTELVAQARTCLSILDTQFGHWHIGADQLVTFDTSVAPEVIKKYGDAIQRIQQVADHQGGLQQTVFAGAKP